MSARPPSVRPPAWAGQFYPGQPTELRREVSRHLAAARPQGGAATKALIAPHAGYVYSGPIAGSAFHCWRGAAGTIRRIILLGPSHRVAFAGLALSEAQAFATPLGQVPVDHSRDAVLLELPQVQVLEEAHTLEHSLEVELPFLQTVLGEFAVVPLVVGDASPGEVAEVVDRLWAGPETRLVISSDLSHYLSYDRAKALDRLTAQAIERLAPEAIGEDQACGRLAILGLLQIARQRQLQARTLDLRNSGDTAGSRDRVVGYGAFVFGDGLSGTNIASSVAW